MMKDLDFFLYIFPFIVVFYIFLILIFYSFSFLSVSLSEFNSEWNTGGCAFPSSLYSNDSILKFSIVLSTSLYHIQLDRCALKINTLFYGFVKTPVQFSSLLFKPYCLSFFVHDTCFSRLMAFKLKYKNDKNKELNRWSHSKRGKLEFNN